MSSRGMRAARALVSLALLALLTLGVPAALSAASNSRFGSPNPLAGVRPPWRWTGDDVGGAARRPLSDDTIVDAIVRVGLVVIWIAVVVVVVTTIVETVHVVRHRGFSLPDVRGLGWAQHLGRFIAAGLIVIGPWTSARASLAAPELASVLPVTAATTAVVEFPATDPIPSAPAVLDTSDDGRANAARHPGSATASGATTIHPPNDRELDPAASSDGADVHVVVRGESVWSIAAELAHGDPAVTVEIAEAILDVNLGAVMDDGQRFTNPAYIETGWVLALPASVDGAIETPFGADPGGERSPAQGGRAAPDPAAGAVHVVEAGDTLSEIAGEHLGGAERWPDIWAENAHATMNDGRRFDDPNLIIPGWELEIPAPAPSDEAPGPDDDPASAVEDDAPVTSDPAPAVDDAPATSVPAPAVDEAPVTSDPAPAGDEAPDGPIVAGPEESRVPSTSSERSPAVPAFGSPTTVGTTSPTTVGTTSPTLGAPATGTSASTSTSVPESGVGRPSDAADGSAVAPDDAPGSPSPLRIEHAAMLAGGILALVGVRRRLRLRAARPRSRVPEPPPDISATERRLRTIDPGERAARIDVAVRAAAAELISTDVQIGLAAVATDGDIELRLTGPAELPPPWIGDDAAWKLPASVPIELLADASRRVGPPCVALTQLGVADDGSDILIDLEASGLLTIEADAASADHVVTAVAAGLGGSVHAEVAHLITVSLPETATLGHRNAHRADSLDAALELAADLVGSTLTKAESTFALRSRQTGGEVWEPAVILLAAGDGYGRDDGGGHHDDDDGHDDDGHHDDGHHDDDGADDQAWAERGDRLADCDLPHPVAGGHGLAIVAATPAGRVPDAHRLVACAAGWVLEAFGCATELTPVGLPPAELGAVTALLDDAERPLVDDAAAVGTAGTGDEPGRPAVNSLDGDIDGHVDAECVPFVGTEHAILVSVMGPVVITDRDGTPAAFERSKTVELIAWLATHRSNSTRVAARTALWELDVRDATFANVVSEARRGLGRLVPPRDDVEWLERTLNEQLPLHPAVVTDAQLIEERLRAATLQPPAQAIETLRPAVELVRDMPFAGTSYLWPDAEGLTSNLVLLATSVTVELAAHGLSTGDIELVFWATSRGLKVLPGHEESIGLRMKAHAEAGDLSGVRQEWDAYERVIVADAWSDGEPAPKLLALRRELLGARR